MSLINPPAIARYDELSDSVKSGFSVNLIPGTRFLNTNLEIHKAAFGELYVSYSGYRIAVIMLLQLDQTMRPSV